MGTGNLMLGVILRWKMKKYSQSLHATETGISSGLIGHLASLQTLPFLTRELRMRNTSYCELWENVSLDRSIRCKLYANEVRTRLSIKLLCNFKLEKAVLKV